MDIRNEREYLQLVIDAENSSRDLEQCDKKEYIAQKKRLYVWAYAKVGDYLYDNSLFSEALEFYAKAKEKDPDEPSVNGQIGICFLQLGKTQRALSCFELLERRADTDIQRAMDHRDAPEKYKAKALYYIAYSFSMDNSATEIERLTKAERAIHKSLKLNPADDKSVFLLKKLREQIATLQFVKFKHGLFKKDLLHNEKHQHKETHSKSFGA